MRKIEGENGSTWELTVPVLTHLCSDIIKVFRFYTVAVWKANNTIVRSVQFSTAILLAPKLVCVELQRRTKRVKN